MHRREVPRMAFWVLLAELLMQCGGPVGQCAVAFHPLCARANKLRMEIASREDSEEVCLSLGSTQ